MEEKEGREGRKDERRFARLVGLGTNKSRSTIQICDTAMYEPKSLDAERSAEEKSGARRLASNVA